MFRLSVPDANVLEKTMEHDNNLFELHKLGKFEARLVRGNNVSQDTMPSLQYTPRPSRVPQFIAQSRSRYAHQRKDLIPIIDRFIEGDGVLPHYTSEKPKRGRKRKEL